MAQQQAEIEIVQSEDPQFTLEDHVIFKRKQQVLGKALKELFQSSVSQFELVMDGTTFAFTKLSVSNKGLDQINQQIWEFPHLRKIDLAFNRLPNINSLIKLKYVTYLDLSRNLIQDAKFLSDQSIFPYLKTINLSGNRVQSLPPIELRNLRHLNLNHNQISTLQQFQGHKKLEILQMRGNKLKSLSGLKGVIALRELFVGQNQLENFDGIHDAPVLLKIHARKNKVSKLSKFPPLKCLTYLNMRQNSISKVDDIQGIIKSVQNLNILGNPLSQQMGDNVKKQLYMRFRQYEKINKVQILPQEKQQFAKEYKQRLAEQQRQRLEREAAQKEAAEQAARQAQQAK